jgi:hypothetical protein
MREAAKGPSLKWLLGSYDGEVGAISMNGRLAETGFGCCRGENDTVLANAPGDRLPPGLPR